MPATESLETTCTEKPSTYARADPCKPPDAVAAAREATEQRDNLLLGGLSPAKMLIGTRVV